MHLRTYTSSKSKLKTGNSESGVHTRHIVVRENRMVFWREDRDRKGHLLAALATYTGKRNSGQKSARVRNVATRQLHANHQARVGDSKRPLHNDPVSQPFVVSKNWQAAQLYALSSLVHKCPR